METTITKSVDEILVELCEVNNLRITIDKIACSIEGLAEHGPLKLEALRGLTNAETIAPAVEMLSEAEKKYAYPIPEGGQRYNPDKTGYRIGIAPPEEVSKRMMEECQTAKNLIHARNVEYKKSLSSAQLKDQIEILRGMVMIAYPAYHGLYEWDHVHMLLEQDVKPYEIYGDVEWHKKEETVIWSCRKEWIKGKLLKDYVPNEKTKIVVKLQKEGSGQPVAEPQIDPETHKKMLAYYYKKQEDQKVLDKDDGDEYMNSEWANPNNLKNSLHGQSKVGFRLS